MANPWDSAPIIEAAPTKKAPAKPVAPRRYSRDAAMSALKKSDAQMNAGLKELTVPQRKKALSAYYASPAIRRLREDAGLPAVRTRTEELADVARKRFREEKKIRSETDFGAARRAGSERALFGIPERIGAALNYFGGASDPNIKSYDEQLQVDRMVNEMQRGRSTSGNVLGQLLGGVAGGTGAAAAVQGTGRAVGAVAPRAGNLIQNLTRLNAGQAGTRAAGLGASRVVSSGERLGNAAKIVAAGAGGGAAQAAGEGSDVETGAAFGAVAAPLVVGGFKGAEWISRPVRDLLRLSSSKGILRRFTNATREEIEDASAAFRQRTGREPTVFEVLPDGDRQAVERLLKKMPDASRERATTLVRERVRAMPGELAGRTDEITAPQQRFMARDLARELAESRGATAPTAAELALARQAVTNPTRMEELRNTVNRNTMAPFDNQPVVQSVDDLVPVAPQNQNGNIVMVETDPDISAMIRRAAGTLRLTNGAVTGQNMTNLRAALQDIADRGGNEGLIAQSAIAHLDDVLTHQAPDIADAAARMRASNTANKTRMQAEAEGRRTRTQADVPVDTRLAGWRSDAAYSTPEGAAGRAAGQRAALMNDFGGKPAQAIGRADEIAESPDVQNAIRGNLGTGAGDEIADMAAAQTESFRRLARLRQPQAGESPDMDFGDLAMSMSLLSPTALVRTKSQAVGTLLRVFAGIPEGRATQIVNALFSREPEQIARALRMLDSAGERGARALRDIVGSVVAGAQAGDTINNIDESRAAPEAVEAESDDDDIVDPAPNPDAPWETAEIVEEGVPYGRGVIEALFPGAEITDDNRDPTSALGMANPGSFHNTTDGAVDLRPIPGMSFAEFIGTLEENGYTILEAIDEVSNPSGHATGPHWHVVLA